MIEYRSLLNGNAAASCRLATCKELTLNPLLVILTILWFVSGAGLVVFILMHSGKGTGVSEMIAGSMYSGMGGSGTVEKNLDRLT